MTTSGREFCAVFIPYPSRRLDFLSRETTIASRDRHRYRPMARHLLTVDGVRKGRSRGQPFQSSFQPTDRRGQPVALRNSLQVSPTPAGGSDEGSFRYNVWVGHAS